MKVLFVSIPLCIVSTIAVYFLSHIIVNSNAEPADRGLSQNLYEESSSSTEGDETPGKGPDDIYIEATGLDKFKPTQQQMEQKWSEVLSRPSENQNDAPYDSWTSLGPNSMLWGNTNTFKANGRALDLEFEGLPTLRVASASGGLWRYLTAGIFTFPVPMSDEVTSLSIGAFATKPGDSNTVFIGTGEPFISAGTGMWKTTNGGTTWTQVALSTTPASFYKIRYFPGSSTRMCAASDVGIFISSNGGLNWSNTMTGNVCEIIVDPVSPNYLYSAKWGVGLFFSSDYGYNWVQGGTGFPTTNIARIALTVCNSSSNVLYANVADGTNNTRGIYKSVDYGSTWGNLYTGPSFHWGQGWYNNCIAVSPTNANMVLAGGGSVMRSTNGGSSWNELGFNGSNDLHADQHVIKWHSNGQTVYDGSDGGVYYSSDAGLTWSSAANILPTAQFYGFSAGVLNNQIVLAGGTQDNSTALTNNTGTQWHLYNGGDGWDAVVMKNNPQTVFAFNNGFFNLTTNGGLSWTPAGSGIVTGAGSHVSNIEDDGDVAFAPYLYVGNSIGSTNKILYSQDYGATFQQFTAATFNTPVWRINVSKFSGTTIVYAIQWNSGSPNQNDILQVYDNGTWYNRGAGLPLTPLRFVAQHPRNNNKVYAITEYYGSAQKIFKSTNRGANWQNITGDLPNIPVMDLIPHPTNDNILYIGTDPFGMWKTTNGGINWLRWTNSMPAANRIQELEYIDSVSNGKFYVLACTFGRGAWIRDGSANDLVSVNNNNGELPRSYELSQNYPNPFNPVTTIRYSLPVDDIVQLKVFDITGREVAKLIDWEIKAGNHDFRFDGSNLPSGIYFYKLTASRFTDTKKMILVK